MNKVILIYLMLLDTLYIYAIFRIIIIITPHGKFVVLFRVHIISSFFNGQIKLHYNPLHFLNNRIQEYALEKLEFAMLHLEHINTFLLNFSLSFSGWTWMNLFDIYTFIKSRNCLCFFWKSLKLVYNFMIH